MEHEHEREVRVCRSPRVQDSIDLTHCFAGTVSDLRWFEWTPVALFCSVIVIIKICRNATVNMLLRQIAFTELSREDCTMRSMGNNLGRSTAALILGMRFARKPRTIHEWKSPIDNPHKARKCHQALGEYANESSS